MEDTRLDRLENKIDKLADKCEIIAVKTAENTSSLQEHMSQTLEVRQQTMLLQQIRNDDKRTNDTRFANLEQFQDRVWVIFKTLGTVLAAIYAMDKMGIWLFLFKLIAGVK